MIRRRAHDERGAATTELVLVTPILIGFLFMVVLAGRLTDARSDVVSAASDAARAASLQPNLGAAQAQAQAIAEDTMAGEGIECEGGPQVTVVPVGGVFDKGETLHLTVSCDVSTSDLALLALPDSVITVQEDAWEPIDTHRSG